MYYIVSEGRNNLNLFLVDRTFIKSRWWSSDLSDAICFRNKHAADKAVKKLIYRNPIVVNKKEANRLEKENERIILELEVHPFSEDALGQY